MVADLIKKNNYYYCSHCRMRQLQPNPNCYFCGNYFSNWESVLIEEFKEDEKDIRRAETDSCSIKQE